MVTKYNNRKHGCGCTLVEETKPETPKDNVTVPVEPKKEEPITMTIGSVKCGKEILSISPVGDNYVVMYADCTYATVSADKVNISTNNNQASINKCLAQSLKDLQEKTKAKDTEVTQLTESLTALQAKLDKLEEKEDKDTIYDDTALKASISSLETALEGKADKGTIPDMTDITYRLDSLETKTAPMPSEIDSIKATLGGLPDFDRELHERDNKLQDLENKFEKYVSYDSLVTVTSLEDEPLYRAIPLDTTRPPTAPPPRQPEDTIPRRP